MNTKNLLLIGILILIVFISGCIENQASTITFNIENTLNQSIYFDYTYHVPIEIFRACDMYSNNENCIRRPLSMIKPCTTCGAPIGSVYELTPGEKITYIWNGTYYEDGKEIQADTGRYKVKFCWSSNFTSAGTYRENNIIAAYLSEQSLLCTEKELELTGRDQTVVIRPLSITSQCSSSNDCPLNYTCYYSKFCPQDSSGNVTCGPQEGDLLCHKKCSTDMDCPNDMPNCEKIKMIYGDAIDEQYLCVK